MLRFKELRVGDILPRRQATVLSYKDWADGSRTVRTDKGIFTRKANVRVDTV